MNTTGKFDILHNECTNYRVEWKMHENKLSIEYDVYVEDNEDLDHFLNGFVKWDGCSNWHFPCFEQCMFHACTREQMSVLSSIPQACWDHAKRTIEGFEGFNK